MDWKLGPPVLVGEKVIWTKNVQDPPRTGTVRWMGKIPDFSSGWCVGLELDKPTPDGGSDGVWMGRKLFECRPKYGLLVPIKEIQKFTSKPNSRPSSIENHLDLKLDGSQFTDLTRSNLERESVEKNQETHRRKHRYSALELKLGEWSLKNRAFDRNSVSGFDFKNKNSDPQAIEDVLDSFTAKQQHILKSKKQDAKLSLKRKRKKRKPSHNSESRRHSRAEYEHRTVKDALENFPDPSENFKEARTLDYAHLKSMNDVAGYFKEIKEDDGLYVQPPDKPLDGMLPFNLQNPNGSNHVKEKKFFSFLKWFKKNKDDPNLKMVKDAASAASSPMFDRKRTSSCESVDTLFSTQTVRSFAYIPPTQYEPSAPPRSLLDFDKSSEENVFQDSALENRIATEETESIYERRKKRRAPEPPRIARENSLPTTLEHRKNDEELMDGAKTFHRRTVSESFKDKKAGAYCHVQGKRKAPLPPPSVTSIYPNLQKLNNTQYSSLHKKKKAAPPPPEIKNDNESQNPTKESNRSTKSPGKDNNVELGVRPKEGQPENLNAKPNESVNPESRDRSNESSKEKLTKDVSLSPLPSRPWYKRSHRDSGGSSIIKKELLKGFEKKKNKETDDWMPEVGFSRRSLSTDSTHNKFNIFARLDKNEDKKKEEKRKSQISILTNISELDREAAEILRKEQAEEKKIIAANDARYYSPNSSPNVVKSGREAELVPKKDLADKHSTKELLKPETELKKNLEKKSETPSPPSNHQEDKGDKLKNVFDEFNMENTKNEYKKSKKEKILDNENLSNSSNEKTKQNLMAPTALTDMTNSLNPPAPEKISKPNQTNLNYFKVENKEVNYLNEPWVCQKCTLENPGWRVFCEICSSVKPKFLFNSPQQKETDRPIILNQENQKPAPDPKPEKTKPEEAKQSFRKSSSKDKQEREPTTPPKREIPEEPNESFKKSPSKEKQVNEPSTPRKREKPEPNLEKFLVEGKPKGENEETEKSLEELRKKRLDFFKSEHENLSGSSKNESPSPETEADNSKLKKILKEMKDSLPKNKFEGENGKESQEENVNATGGQKDTKVAQAAKANAQIKTSPVTSQDDGVKYGAIKKKQPPQAKKEKVVEAYIVTTTTVLEDIIIKKADQAPKVSASVQTKSSLPVQSQNSVRPPPRTKKTSTRAEPTLEVKKEPGPVDEVKRFIHEDLEELTNRLTQAEGLADFRANIETMPLNTEMNTVAVNRLLRKLETAINCGDHFVAAGLAKELALMKINCSVTRQVSVPPALSSSKITIDLYVEDKVSHQGPIPIQVSPAMTLLQLKKKIQQELNIPIEVQRWILGKSLATDDNKTLESHGINADSCSVFLYLVAPDKREAKSISPEKSQRNDVAKSQKEPSPKEPPRGKGWYYNYEEDHYSYCEDSEDESSSETKLPEPKPTTHFQKEMDPPEQTKKLSVLDLKTREAENDVEKELKLISRNSVRQKVEELNKTFAENSKAARVNLGQSSETWKCVACTFVNPRVRFACSACNAKKIASRMSFSKVHGMKEPLEKLNDKSIPANANNGNVHYKELIELQDADLVPNAEPFNCPVCMVDYAPGEGVTLKDCLHTFCRTCLINTVRFSDDAEVKCPYVDDAYSCTSVLQQREIKALVPRGIFESHLAKSVKEAENKIGNAFHCKTPDCKGWCIYEDNVNEFHCPVCKLNNCLTCHAIHTNINCKQYQEKMKYASETDVDAKKTREMLEQMVEKGEAMACPKCQVVLMKKWGCDWLRCSMCKTEICWVTRGFRWGPGGKGDSSAGCKCGVNGVKCHPKCNYCH